MEISRISYKVFMDQGEDVTTETWFKVFNTWIPDPDDDILVDVADYTHVQNGPQTILVGHRANYVIDTTAGRFGFLYARKRALEGSLSEGLEEVISAGLRACKRLDDDDRLHGKVKFNGESAQIILNDRLGAANDAVTFDALKSHLNPILDRLYAGASYEINRDEDARRCLTVNIRASAEFGPAQLIENLGS